MTGNFSEGRTWRNIVSQSVPLLFAQLVQLLYNVVDRIYIGHLHDTGSIALTGIGLAFPLTTLIAAFTNLFGMGGTPLFSIARGAKENIKAEKILSHCLMLLTASSFILFAVCFIFRKPVLYAFGASDESFRYADRYLKIYLFGTTFSMLSTGLNGFINAQGYPKTGMLTIFIGAALNLVLDPLFIFAFDMGIEGAAIATVISQAVSAVWVMLFLFGKNNTYRIKKEYLVPDPALVSRIIAVGLAGFIMQATSCLVQIVSNLTLKDFGGDIYVGIMTVLNSIRDIFMLPINSLTNGSQPVISYNYGAKKYSRVREGIKFTASIGFVYTVIAWAAVLLIPHFLMSVFTSDSEMINMGVSSLKLYFFGFCFMSMQFAGQSTFVALGCTKRAIFFSLLRKAIIVVPLTIILPRIGFGVKGVFLAEPVSNLFGGAACFLTMWFTLYRKLPENDDIQLYKGTSKNPF